jgi:hypothetical protein
LIEFICSALADSVQIRLWMPLVKRDELGTKTKTDNGNIYFVTHCFPPCLYFHVSVSVAGNESIEAQSLNSS